MTMFMADAFARKLIYGSSRMVEETDCPGLTPATTAPPAASTVAQPDHDVRPEIPEVILVRCVIRIVGIVWIKGLGEVRGGTGGGHGRRRWRSYDAAAAAE